MSNYEKADPEDIIENGVGVLDISYETDNPGVGAGIESVILHDDHYWYKPDLDEPVGPYSYLMDAVIENELNILSPTVDSITVIASEATALVSVLKARYNAPFDVVLNGKTITISEEI